MARCKYFLQRFTSQGVFQSGLDQNSLDAYLIAPVQRIPRYILLLSVRTNQFPYNQ